MAVKPRQRLLLSAITLMCERGVHATGLTELLEHSNTARASIYQHFPEGKSALMEEATYAAGRQITQQMQALAATRTPVGVIEGMVDSWQGILAGSDYTMGCPIQAASQSGPSEPKIQAASASVFADWRSTIASSLTAAGAAPDAAAPLASFIVSSIEGAITQCRSAKTTQPLDDVRSLLGGLIAAAITPAPGPS